MVAILRIAVSVALLGCVYSVDDGQLVTIEREQGGPAAPKSSTLTNKFCGSEEGLICPKGNVLQTKFTPTAYLCHSLCVQAAEGACLNAHWNGAHLDGFDGKCTLKDASCTSDELVPGQGTDYMRLPRGESCPADRPEYKKPKEKFTSTFCAMYGKKCSIKGQDDHNYNMYASPQGIKPWINCLKKCMKIIECASADFVGNKCYINNYHCPDEELVDAEPGDINFMRLPKADATTGCPKNRGSAPPGGGDIPEPEEPAPETEPSEPEPAEPEEPEPSEPEPAEPEPAEPEPSEPEPAEPEPAEPEPAEPEPAEPEPSEPEPAEPEPAEPEPAEPEPAEPEPAEPEPAEPEPAEPEPSTPAPCLCPCNATQDADGNCQCDAGFKKEGDKCVPDCPARD